MQATVRAATSSRVVGERWRGRGAADADAEWRRRGDEPSGMARARVCGRRETGTRTNERVQRAGGVRCTAGDSRLGGPHPVHGLVPARGVHGSGKGAAATYAGVTEACAGRGEGPVPSACHAEGVSRRMRADRTRTASVCRGLAVPACSKAWDGGAWRGLPSIWQHRRLTATHLGAQGAHCHIKVRPRIAGQRQVRRATLQRRAEQQA